MSSVQFRSRIKPAFNYSDTLNSYGVCCGPTGDIKTIRSFTECFNEGGHYIPVPDGNTDSVSCPDSDTRLGCCCACSYVTLGQLDQIPTLDAENGSVVGTPYLTSGIQSNVSRCECERRNGKWTEGPCPATLDNIDGSTGSWRHLCVKGVTTDVRTPRSCCHLEFDEATGWPIGVACTDVCTSGDCALLGTETYPSIFGSTRCFIPIVSGGEVTTCATQTNLSFMATRSTIYDGFEIGSCYTLEDNNGTLEYNCIITPKELCDSYWVAEQDQTNPLCTSSFMPSNPIKSEGRYQVQRMGYTAFQDIGLTPGDEFQGGIFVGIFKPPYLNGKSSEVYGNLNFGTPTLTTVNGDSIGGTYAQWALIADKTMYEVAFNLPSDNDTDYNTSLWDGYYNTYGDNTFNGIQNALTNTIKYADRKGFIDFYIPSIYELHFYSAYLNTINVKTVGNLLSSSIFSTKYLNKTIQKTKINGNGFVYGVGINSSYSTNYKTILLEKKTTSRVLLFRRIVLE
jgi:hypothetical protein